MTVCTDIARVAVLGVQVGACPNTPIGHILRGNNTPQAYPAVRCGDAQTGGLLFSGLTDAAQTSKIFNNTPAMSLNDAHSGGFFTSGVCR